MVQKALKHTSRGYSLILFCVRAILSKWPWKQQTTEMPEKIRTNNHGDVVFVRLK